MKPSAQNLYKEQRDSHSKIYKLISELRNEVEKCNNYVELCDYALAVDQAHNFAEDLKTELWKLREQVINKKICELWMGAQIQANFKLDRSIKTDYVTATPDISQSVNLPSQKNDPAGYKAFMDYLGIDTTKWGTKTLQKGEHKGEKVPNELLRFHWPDLCEYVKNLQAAGKPAPPGLDITEINIYKVLLRKKRDVLDVIPNNKIEEHQSTGNVTR